MQSYIIVRMRNTSKNEGSMSVHCSLVVTCRERANLLALLYVMFSCVFCHFPMCCPGSGVVLYCIDPDLCLLTYFYSIRLCTSHQHAIC